MREMTFVCMLLLLGILLHGNHAHPFSIITADGTCKPLSLLEKKWVEEGYTESAVPLAVTVLDADGTSTTSKLCNAILGTSFTDNDIGMSLSSRSPLKNSSFVLRAQFNALTGAGFTAQKALKFAQSFDCPVFSFLAVATTLDEFVIKYEYTLRHIFRAFHSPVNETQPPSLHSSEKLKRQQQYFVVIVQSDSSNKDSVLTKDSLQQLLQSWYIAEGAAADTKSLDIQVILSAETSAAGDDIDAASETIKELLLILNRDSAQESSSLSTADLVQKWNFLSRTTFFPLMDQKQQESLYILSKAYLDCTKTAEDYLSLLHKRVFSGEDSSFTFPRLPFMRSSPIHHRSIIASFGQKIETLLQGTVSDFTNRVQGRTHPSHLQDRAQRVKELQTLILSSALELLTQQVLNQERDTVNKLKEGLLTLYSKSLPANTQQVHSLNETDKQQLLQQVLTTHNRILTEELENEALGLVISQQQREEFAQRLEQELRDFPQSPAYKLLLLRHAERQIATQPKKQQQQQRHKNKKGLTQKFGILGFLAMVKLSTTLVAMLRPPGVGNLQGYVNYRTGFLGRPLDLLLGVQNDGESSEIVSEEREHPLLRIQPKLHFDIDF